MPSCQTTECRSYHSKGATDLPVVTDDPGAPTPISTTPVAIFEIVDIINFASGFTNGDDIVEESDIDFDIGIEDVASLRVQVSLIERDFLIVEVGPCFCGTVHVFSGGCRSSGAMRLGVKNGRVCTTQIPKSDTTGSTISVSNMIFSTDKSMSAMPKLHR